MMIVLPILQAMVGTVQDEELAPQVPLFAHGPEVP